MEQAIETVGDRFGGLDVLVNNAGVGIFRSVTDMTVDEWHRVMETNLTGVFYCCRAALPHLRARGGGWIINVSSLSSTGPFAEGAAYCASKAGLNAFTRGADAGGAAGRHSRRLRPAGIGAHRVQRPIAGRMTSGSWRRKTWRRS